MMVYRILIVCEKCCRLHQTWTISVICVEENFVLETRTLSFDDCADRVPDRMIGQVRLISVNSLVSYSEGGFPVALTR